MNNALDTVESPEYLVYGLVAEEVKVCLRAGREPDADALAARYPEHAEAIRELVPTMSLVHALGRESADEAAARELPLPGSFKDFVVLREIGRGGMGVVYEAEQLSLKRRVALKVLPFAAALDERQRQRFVNETRAAAGLHHDHIVPVFEGGCENGVPYYAMRFIDGRSLAARIGELRAARDPAATRDPAYVRQAVAWVVQAADGLEYAHRRGILHRDVKPANLLVDAQGRLWLTDFGLARFADEEGLTESFDVVGTLHYMSPEQARAVAGVVDQRTDVYALGVTLYELLTLEKVFPEADRQGFLYYLAKMDPRPPRRLNPAIPVELETILLKTLAKAPAERYVTAGELADDLRRFLGDQPIQARRPTLLERGAKWARRHRGVVRAAASVAACGVVFLAAAAGLLYRERQRADAGARKANAVVDEMYTRVAERWLARTPHLEEVQREFLDKALAHYEEAAQSAGTDPEALLQRARAWRRVADIRQQGGRHQESVAAYDRAAELLARLPAGPEVRWESSRGQNNRGNLLRDAGCLPDAEASYRAAQEALTQLLADDRDNADYQDALAGSWNNLGLTWHALSRHADAERAYHEASALLARLTLAHPDAPAFKHDAASVQNNLGTLLRATGRWDEAEKVYRRALQLGDALQGTAPSLPEYRRAAAATLNNLGLLYAEAGKAKEAEAAYRQALELRARLAADFPRAPVYRRDWAATLDCLGNLLTEHRRPAEAGPLFRKALALREQLLNEAPDTPLYARELSWFLATCPDAGVRDPLRAVQLARHVVEQSPEDVAGWRTLGVAHYYAGDWPAAQEALEKTVAQTGGGQCADWLLLAHAYAFTGDRQRGRDWLGKATTWLEQHPTRHTETRRLRDAAATLLNP